MLYAAAPLALLAGEGIVEIAAWLRSDPLFRREQFRATEETARRWLLASRRGLPVSRCFTSCC